MTDSLKVYDILTGAHIPDHQARAITEAIREAESTTALNIKAVLDEHLSHLATKADMAELKSGLHADMAELKSDLKELKLATKSDLTELKSATRAELADAKSELTRWMFVFWVGQMAATIAIVKLWK